MPSSSAAPTLHATHPIADARMGLNHWCRACTWTCATFFSLIIFAATLAPASCVDDTSPPPPPTWPTLFSAQMMSNRSNHFALQHLWYDWDFHAGVGRQIIRIVKEDGNMIYDVMPGDGNAYYIDPHRRTCSAIKFGVSILTPDWQLEGEYLGRRLVDGMSCYSWRKGFGIQCTSEADEQPLLITFAQEDKPAWTVKFLTYELGDAAPEELYTIPPFCPKPAPLPPEKMAQARRMLRSFKSHTPHILLDDQAPEGADSPNIGVGVGRRDILKGVDAWEEATQVGTSDLPAEHVGGCPYLHHLFAARDKTANT